ncbi:MAG: amidohydrolase family protein [Hyphomicrobiales bacterium]
MRIIDAHQHFWDLQANYLPWLCDEPPIRFRYGDYSALKRNYLPEDYRRDTARFEVEGTVFVETEWNPDDPVGETEWVRDLAACAGLPSVMVAQAWLDRADVEAVLASHGRHPLVRGVRHKPAAASNPGAVTTDNLGSMSDPAWRRGYALLERHELSFDLQVPWWQLAEARKLADDFGGVPIILNHTGLPADRSPEGLAGWRKGLEALAGAPNTFVKISGLGVPDMPWTAESNRRIVLDAVEIFGTDRCMFASNFPVDGLVADFETIFSGYDSITAHFSESERASMFSENARRIYRFPQVRSAL